MMTQGEKTKSKGGRPPKFSERTTPVTMRLPASAIRNLARIDSDRTKAVVKAAEAVVGDAATEPSVRRLSISRNEALITIPDCPHLRSIPWLRLIEIAPGKNLLSIHKGVPIEKLEVTIEDVLDSAEDLGDDERAALGSLIECIRMPRRSQRVRTEEILLVGIHSPSPRKKR